MPLERLRSAEDKLRAARATFGASSCHLLRIHGGGGDDAGAAVPWEQFIDPPMPDGGAGEPTERPPVPAQARWASSVLTAISTCL